MGVGASTQRTEKLLQDRRPAAHHRLLRLRRLFRLRVDQSGSDGARADGKEVDCFPPAIHLVDLEGRRQALEAVADEVYCHRCYHPTFAGYYPSRSPP